jgi:hypothetical protein
VTSMRTTRCVLTFLFCWSLYISGRCPLFFVPRHALPFLLTRFFVHVQQGTITESEFLSFFSTQTRTSIGQLLKRYVLNHTYITATIYGMPAVTLTSRGSCVLCSAQGARPHMPLFITHTQQHVLRRLQRKKSIFSQEQDENKTTFTQSCESSFSCVLSMHHALIHAGNIIFQVTALSRSLALCICMSAQHYPGLASRIRVWVGVITNATCSGQCNRSNQALRQIDTYMHDFKLDLSPPFGQVRTKKGTRYTRRR